MESMLNKKQDEPLRFIPFALVIFFRLYRISLAFSGHLVIFQIFIICGDFVDQLSSWNNFHNAVGSCLNDLMVSGTEQNYHNRVLDRAGICYQRGYGMVPGGAYRCRRTVYHQ